MKKAKTLLPDNKTVSHTHFASFHPGSIDYSPFHATIKILIEAMEKKKVCNVTYGKIMAKRSKTFYIQPLKLFSHRDTVYLHTRKARTPGKAIQRTEL